MILKIRTLYSTFLTYQNNNNNNKQPAEPIWGVIDLKTTSGATPKQLVAKNIVGKYRNLARKKQYKRPPLFVDETEPHNDQISDREDTINALEDIAVLQPGKNAQLAAKKISDKYKKIREAKRKKNILRIAGEGVRVETVETPQGNAKVPVSITKSNISAFRTADKIKQKYKTIRQKKALKLATLRGNEQTINETEKNQNLKKCPNSCQKNNWKMQKDKKKEQC